MLFVNVVMMLATWPEDIIWLLIIPVVHWPRSSGQCFRGHFSIRIGNRRSAQRVGRYASDVRADRTLCRLLDAGSVLSRGETISPRPHTCRSEDGRGKDAAPGKHGFQLFHAAATRHELSTVRAKHCPDGKRRFHSARIPIQQALWDSVYSGRARGNQTAPSQPNSRPALTGDVWADSTVAGFPA